MDRFIRLFASMKFAFWSLAGLVVWFFAGVVLGGNDQFKKGFQKMNDLLILDWLKNEATGNILIFIWFAGLCIVGGLVFMSFIFCTFTTLRKHLSKGRLRVRSRIMFLLHLVFILIVVFHIVSMVTGFKYGYQKAFVNSILRFDNSIAVEVHQIRFVNDPEVLKSRESHSKIRLTKENFNIDENFVEISLFRDGEFLARGKSRFLKPYVYKNIRVTIENFFVDDKVELDKIGVRLVVSKNPVLLPFFTLYAIAVVLMLLWTILTWKDRT